MNKTIAIFGRYGSGKSTLAANLACSLASRDRVVILVSANRDYGGLQVFFGETIPDTQGTFAVLADDADQPQRMLTPCKSNPNIFLLGTPNNKKSYNTEGLYEDKTKRLLQQLQTYADYVIVDCVGDQRDPFTILALRLADQILCTYTMSAETGLWHQAMQSLFRQLHAKSRIKPVIGQWDIGCSREEFLKLPGMEAAVQLPEVEDALIYQNTGIPIYMAKAKDARQYQAAIDALTEGVGLWQIG